jgi:hypothetical protein
MPSYRRSVTDPRYAVVSVWCVLLINVHSCYSTPYSARSVPEGVKLQFDT